MDKAVLVSQSYSGNVSFGVDYTRPYLYIQMSAAGTIKVGDGDGVITLAAGGVYEPRAVPLNALVLTTTGTTVVVTNATTHATAT